MHQERAAALARTAGHLSNLRLLTFATIAGCVWAVWAVDLLAAAWLLAPGSVFLALVTQHSRVRKSHAVALRAIAYYQRGLARIEDRWSGQGPTGERFDDPHHLYAADLDLFGCGSLFQLLFTGRTRMGEHTLAGWLLAPAQRTEILERHACIADLRERLDLREDLALLGEDREVSVQPNALLQWAQAPNPLTQAWLSWVAIFLPLLLVAAVIVWHRFDVLSPLVAIVLIEVALLRSLSQPLHEVLHGTENAFEDLRLLAALPARLERETFTAAPLQALQRALASHDLSAAKSIARLASIVQWIESRRNPLLALLQVPLLYPIHTALAAQRWRVAHGHAVAVWLDTIGRIEALNSIAAYSYEHPADPLPQFVEGAPSFVAQSLGHPLISADRCIRNDVGIEGGVRVLLVSGSNMSGKSTLLRTVGTNTVLAMAGAPVRAASLQLTALQVGASIRINDSLHEGSSRFYAEIQRLRHPRYCSCWMSCCRERTRRTAASVRKAWCERCWTAAASA